MRRILIFLALALFASTASAQQQTPQRAARPPAWFAAHVDFISRAGGTWRTDNPAAGSQPDAPDAFAMEWRAAYGGSVLIGRLYGLKRGREIAEYWTYREFWHPGERRVILEQRGGEGTYGVGATTMIGQDRTTTEQTFYLPDGRSWREGHLAREDGDVYVTESYNIDADGHWTLNASHTWRRVVRR